MNHHLKPLLKIVITLFIIVVAVLLYGLAFRIIEIKFHDEIRSAISVHDTILKRDTVFLSSPLPNQNSNTEDQDVKPGQVWIYQSSDPFEPIRDERTVIAVKNGCVQYKRQTGGVDSWPLDWFKFGSHLKK